MNSNNIGSTSTYIFKVSYLIDWLSRLATLADCLTISFLTFRYSLVSGTKPIYG